jgi:hypothetical protein
MKKIITILVSVLFTLGTFAQAPKKMSYQAVVRNSSNALVQSSPVGIKVSILRGSITGPVKYVETHTPQTNQNGLFDIEIGGGTLVTGNYVDSVLWSNGPYFLKTEIDPNGGTNYSITMTSELLSVPYANYAHVAGTAETQSGIANPGWGAWGNFTVQHNKKRRPKKVTIKYFTTLNGNYSNIVINDNYICESEWYDDDRDGLGNLFYHTYLSHSTTNTDLLSEPDLLSNTNSLGKFMVSPTLNGGAQVLLQDITISSTLNDIIISSSTPINYINPSYYLNLNIVGPWKVLYNIEW